MNSNQVNKYISVENAIVIDTRKHFEVTNMHKLFLSQEMYSSSCLIGFKS